MHDYIVVSDDWARTRPMQWPSLPARHTDRQTDTAELFEIEFRRKRAAFPREFLTTILSSETSLVVNDYRSMHTTARCLHTVALRRLPLLLNRGLDMFVHMPHLVMSDIFLSSFLSLSLLLSTSRVSVHALSSHTLGNKSESQSKSPLLLPFYLHCVCALFLFKK